MSASPQTETNNLSDVHGLTYIWALHQAGWQFHELATKQGKCAAENSGKMGRVKNDYAAKVNRVRAALRGRGLQYDVSEACFSNSGEQILMSATPSGALKLVKVHIPWKGYLDKEKLDELNHKTGLNITSDPTPQAV